MDRSILAAETALARVVEPSNKHIIHVPGPRAHLNGRINADRIEIVELVIENDGSQLALQAGNVMASWNRIALCSNDLRLARGSIILVAGEGKVAVRAKRLAAK